MRGTAPFYAWAAGTHAIPAAAAVLSSPAPAEPEAERHAGHPPPLPPRRPRALRRPPRSPARSCWPSTTTACWPRWCRTRAAPGCAAPPATLLARLARRYPVAAVSGRSWEHTRRLTEGVAPYVVGNHGFELLHARPVPAAVLRQVRGWRRQLEADAGRGAGHPLRGQALDAGGPLRAGPGLAARRAGRLRRRQPAAAGRAWCPARRCSTSCRASSPTRATPSARCWPELGLAAALYLGDDVTDEDAFAVGEPLVLGVHVGPGRSLAPVAARRPGAASTSCWRCSWRCRRPGRRWDGAGEPAAEAPARAGRAGDLFAPRRRPRRRRRSPCSSSPRRSRRRVEPRFRDVHVRGEVANLRVQASGHVYFTLKDEGATLPCVLWAGAGAAAPLRRWRRGWSWWRAAASRSTRPTASTSWWPPRWSRTAPGALALQLEQLKAPAGGRGAARRGAQAAAPLPAAPHRRGHQPHHRGAARLPAGAPTAASRGCRCWWPRAASRARGRRPRWWRRSRRWRAPAWTSSW